MSNMVLKGKLISEIEVNSSPDDTIYNQFRYKPYQIPAFSRVVQDCELVHGAFGESGSVIRWHYTKPDGKPCSAKEVVQFEEGTETIVITIIEGDVMADYKSLVATLHTTPRGGGTVLVRWTIDYEKLHGDSPVPLKSLDSLLAMIRDIEIAHVKNASEENKGDCDEI